MMTILGVGRFFLAGAAASRPRVPPAFLHSGAALFSSSAPETSSDSSPATTASSTSVTTASPSDTPAYRQVVKRRDYRFIFPEFLPDPQKDRRNHVVEKLVRKDLLRRRAQVEIPEFYVGSVMAVTFSDPNSPSPTNTSRFVGICIQRGGTGLYAWLILRNVIDGQGVEFMFNMYSPTIVKIETLRLEKRLDDELLYLRDAPQEYSTFPEDMEMEILPEGQPVPINDIVIPLESRCWTRRWELYKSTGRLVGYDYAHTVDDWHEKKRVRLEKYHLRLHEGWQMETVKYDLLLQYRETIPIEEQDAIWAEVGDELEQRDRAMRKVAAKRAFVKPTKERS